MDEIEIRKMFFFPICNKKEIECIFNVRDAKDYLLKLRAETIVNHMRLFRVYRNKALIDEKNWSLEKSFDMSHYDAFLKNLPHETKRMCLKTTFGNIFSNDPNGSIFKTDYGPIITISDSLRFFLKFMHLALLEFQTDVPPHIRMNALRIAIRVMLKTETLDFLMDPRGIVPQDVYDAIHAPIPLQMEFIASHEFAHYILGHLSDSKVVNKPIYFAISPKDEDYKPMAVYNQSQKEEFEADIQAILLPQYDQKKRKHLIEAVLLWFGCLDLYEAVCNAICPRSPWSYLSHPTAKERFKNILTTASSSLDINQENWKGFMSTVENFKEFLLQDVSVNIETYHTYGSVYLDKPNTEWRGAKLVDRVDYY